MPKSFASSSSVEGPELSSEPTLLWIGILHSHPACIVFAVSWLKAVSFKFPLAPSQLLNDWVELVQAGLNNPAYGRPEENSMTLVSVQPESSARPVSEPVSGAGPGNGINQLQYNPIGTNCGDGATLNQTCYLVSNSGPGNFGTLQEINPNGLPRCCSFQHGSRSKSKITEGLAAAPPRDGSY